MVQALLELAGQTVVARRGLRDGDGLADAPALWGLLRHLGDGKGVGEDGIRLRVASARQHSGEGAGGMKPGPCRWRRGDARVEILIVSGALLPRFLLLLSCLRNLCALFVFVRYSLSTAQ